MHFLRPHLRKKGPSQVQYICDTIAKRCQYLVVGDQLVGEGDPAGDFGVWDGGPAGDLGISAVSSGLQCDIGDNLGECSASGSELSSSGGYLIEMCTRMVLSASILVGANLFRHTASSIRPGRLLLWHPFIRANFFLTSFDILSTWLLQPPSPGTLTRYQEQTSLKCANHVMTDLKLMPTHSAVSDNRKSKAQQRSRDTNCRQLSLFACRIDPCLQEISVSGCEGHRQRNKAPFRILRICLLHPRWSQSGAFFRISPASVRNWKLSVSEQAMPSRSCPYLRREMASQTSMSRWLPLVVI